MEKKYICPACKKAYENLDDAIKCAQNDSNDLKNKDTILQDLERTREKIETNYYSLKELINAYNEDVEKYSIVFGDNNVTKFYLNSGCSCGGNCKNKKVSLDDTDTIENILSKLFNEVAF